MIWIPMQMTAGQVGGTSTHCFCAVGPEALPARSVLLIVALWESSLELLKERLELQAFTLARNPPSHAED